MSKHLDKFNSHNVGDDLGDTFAPAFEAIRKVTGDAPRAPWKGKSKRHARRAAINGKHAYLESALFPDADE